jgi:gas vesicle protein
LTEKVERCRSEFNVKIKEMTSKCEELELKHKEEVTELSQQHSLEMEVELDKVKSDLLVQIDQLENEVKSQIDKVQSLQSDLSSAAHVFLSNQTKQHYVPHSVRL